MKIHRAMDFCITTDTSKFDIDFISTEISNSYWASDRSKAVILKSIGSSLCFAIFVQSKQVGFARVISDYATFAYLCDVVVTKKYQRQGVGKKLLTAVFNHTELSTVRWVLRTKEAHGLYKKFNFITTTQPERYMERA